MVLCDDDRLAERCRSLRNLCFKPERRFVHDELGWNFRMTNLQAALGVAQLERLAEHIARKRQIGQLYDSLLQGVEGIQTPLPRTAFAQNIYWVYGIVLRRETNAQEMMRRLAAVGVGTRPFFFPMHQQPVFRKMGLFEGQSHPVAENIAEMGFYLPSGLGITDEQIHQVVERFKSVLA